MRKSQPFNCDVCGAERKETNHWFVAVPSVDSATEPFKIYTWKAARFNRLLEMRTSKKAGAKHVCGQRCLLLLVDQLTSSTLPAQTLKADAAPENPADGSTLILRPPLGRDGRPPEEQEKADDQHTQ
jgi:hypothetical protein